MTGVNDDPQALDLQSLQRALQFLRPVGRRLDPDETGKLPPEMAHPTFQPVAAPDPTAYRASGRVTRMVVPCGPVASTAMSPW